jgi:hypothetical protein
MSLGQPNPYPGFLDCPDPRAHRKTKTSIYLWQYADNVSDNLIDHCRENGGIAVVAQSLDHARAIIETAFPACTALSQEPVTFELAKETEPAIWVFPDFGCC